MDIAVAGSRGLALYSRRSARWRLFGDISQERELAVQVWLPWLGTAKWSVDIKLADPAITHEGVTPRTRADPSAPNE